MQMKYSKVDVHYRQKRSKEEVQHQLITFSIMIFLTCLAFSAVALQEKVSSMFLVPFILLLGCVQVIFQLYYFMHMKHRGHEMVRFFLYSGIAVGFITILTFLTIV